MALTATFEANFSSFYDAVTKATVQLREFDDGANKVEKSLSKMADAFSGRKVIQDATLMAEAIERIGGASALTEAELAKVGRTAGEAVEKMKALGMEVPANLQALADATKGAATESEGAAISFGTLVSSYVTGEAIINALTTAYHAFVDVLTDSVSAALEAEETDAALEAALRSQGTAVPSVTAAYEQYAKALQDTTTYSAGAAKAAEAILVQFGGVMPRDMERAIKATADLATRLGVDLPEAARIMAKAADGDTQALERYQIHVKASQGTTANFGDVLTAVEGKFGGAARAAGDTLPGQLKKLNNAWSDVQESLGKVITNNETVRTALAGLNDLLKGNSDELDKNKTANNLVSDAVLLLVKGLSLGVEGLDYFQKELRDVRKVVDAFSLGITDAYVTLQRFEKATQTPLAWAGSEEAKKRVQEATAAIDEGTKHIADLRRDMAQADTTSAGWSTRLGKLREDLRALETRLEGTRGMTRANADEVRKLIAESKNLDASDPWGKATENQKALAEAQAEAAKKAKEQADAMAELNSIGETWQDTLASMDQTTVDNIAHFLELGASTKTLATAYGVTELQIKAVALAMKDAAEAAKLAEAQTAAQARLDLELQKARGEASANTLRAQIANLEAWGVAQAAAMTKAKTYTKEAYDTITAIVNQSTANIIQKTLEADPLTAAHYKKLATDAEEAYSRSLEFYDEYTDEARTILQDQMEDAHQKLADWQTHANEALKSTADTAYETGDAVHHVGEEFRQMGEEAKSAWDTINAGRSRMEGVGGQIGIDLAAGAADLRQRYGGTPFEQIAAGRGPTPIPQGAGAWTLDWAQAQKSWDMWVAKQILQGRAAGGPVAPGQTYLVGERGPELFRPGTSGAILPHGGGTAVRIEPGAIVLNYPIMSDPRAMDQLARHVGDAILSKLTRTGARV